MTPQQVLKRNRRHTQHGGDARLAGRTAAHRLPLHREQWHRPLTFEQKQPGRTSGPAPQQNYPQRQVRLTADQRLSRYYAAPGHLPCPATPRPEEEDLASDAAPSGVDARRHAALLGVTLRQRRRTVHKANHATAPFGKRAEG